MLHVFAVVGGSIELVRSIEVESCSPGQPFAINQVKTVEGEDWQLRRGGCGCGAARNLRSFDWRHALERIEAAKEAAPA